MSGEGARYLLAVEERQRIGRNLEQMRTALHGLRPLPFCERGDRVPRPKVSLVRALGCQLRVLVTLDQHAREIRV